MTLGVTRTDGVAVKDHVGRGVRVLRDLCVAVAECVLDGSTRVGVAVGASEALTVGVGLREGSAVVGSGTRVGVGVAARRTVNVTEGLGPGLTVRAVRVALAVGERVAVRDGTTLRVGEAVREDDGEGVADTTRVMVGVEVGAGTAVAPTRILSQRGIPTTPLTSRTLAISHVSPRGNAREDVTGKQNCAVARPAATNRGRPNSSTVQARPTFGLATAPQAQSDAMLRLVASSSRRKTGTPGTPPSHGTGLPSPTLCEAWIRTSGPGSGTGPACGTKSPTARP